MTTENETTGLLTEDTLQQIRHTDDMQRFDDGGGLYLQVMSANPPGYHSTRSGMYWHYKYTFRGRDFAAFLGDYPKMSLEEARRKAAEIAEEHEPEHLDIVEIEDLLADRLRWAHAVVDLVMCDENTDDGITNALSGADNYIREARRYLDSLEHWRREHLPHTRERDLTNGSEREAEKREILERLQRLPQSDARDIIFAHGSLWGADEETKAEAWELLNKGRGMETVTSYLYLRSKGDVQIAPEKVAN